MKINDELQAKLGLKTNTGAYLLHANAEYEELLPATSLETIEDLKGDAEWIQAFYQNAQELNNELSTLKNKLSKNGQLWICWPKKSFGLQSDLSDAVVRQAGLDVGLVDVKIVAVNKTWSGLKFVYRLSDR